MIDNSTYRPKLPSEQEAVKAKCFHPSGNFIEFEREVFEQSIPERFERIVRLYPHRPAMSTGERSLTYDQLNRAANRIARAILERRGAGSEPIALLFEHGIDVIAAIFGALKAGKFYVALDPSFPPERISYILNDSLASCIVTNEKNILLAKRLAGGDGVTLNVDNIHNSFNSDNLALTLKPENLAAIMYTSGSTGAPKGTVDTHGYRLRGTKNLSQFIGVRPNDRLTLLHSVSFGSAQGHLFSSLLTGASLWPFDLKNKGVRPLAEWLFDNRITVLHLPPMAFRQLSEFITDRNSFGFIRVIRLTGAPITKHDFDLYRKHWPRQTSLAIHMASTETGAIAQAVLDHSFQFPKHGTPVGYASPDKTIVLVDENGQSVAPGEPGELLVRGRDLKAGYWEDFKANRAKVSRYLNDGNDCMHLTGDIARILPDGFLIHMGRKDFMVKIRGYRVELGEIEIALGEHPQIREAGVVAWDCDPGEKFLVGYIVARGEPRPPVDEVRSFLKTKLPNYMIPSSFVFLESLPLTNGKLDRTALPKPSNKRPELTRPFTSPRNEVEQRLVEIWAEVLKVDKVGIHDQFLDLGGHSLTATRIISRVIKTFGLEMPVQTLFQSATVAKMATVISVHQNEKQSENRLNHVLTQLESLSEQEAKECLATYTKTLGIKTRLQ